jgi:hypothetical protein
MIAPFASFHRATSWPLLAPDPAPAEPIEGEAAPPAGAPTPAVPEIDGGERQVANDAGQPLTLGKPAGSGTARA